MQKCPCGKHANFNMPGEKLGICCKICKIVGMVDVIHKRCPCGTRPSYNVPGEKTGVCCKRCKVSGMINVVSNRCPCGKQPIFNMPGKTKGVYCKDCKTNDMVDVSNKRCLCGKQPVFNLPLENVGMFCKDCKTDKMIDVVNRRCPCGIVPIYNIRSETIGVCCKVCKTDDMVDVMNKFCPGYNGEKCPVRTQVSRGHKYCVSCDPDDARRKRYKMFEDAFFRYIKDKLNVHQREFRISFDPNETAKKFARLDGIVFGDGIIVCIEVDENGHREYECDEHRMHLVTAELLQKYPGHAVSWIRVNPTIGSKNEWNDPSKRKREKRFEDVVSITGDILKTRDTRVVYIGFD